MQMNTCPFFLSQLLIQSLTLFSSHLLMLSSSSSCPPSLSFLLSPSLDSTCSLHLPPHLHSNTSSVSFSLYPYLALCVYLSILPSLISPWLYQYPPPALLSFIFHSRVLSPPNPPSPICIPIPLMDDVALRRGPQSVERGFAVESNLKANSTDSHRRVLQHDVAAITCGRREREQPLRDAAAGAAFALTVGQKGKLFLLLSNWSIEKCISLEFGHVGAWQPHRANGGWLKEHSVLQGRRENGLRETHCCRSMALRFTLQVLFGKVLAGGHSALSCIHLHLKR